MPKWFGLESLAYGLTIAVGLVMLGYGVATALRAVG